MPNDLTTISIVDILPGSIKNDATVLAAAQSIDAELQAVSALCLTPSLYARIDDLTSEQLDHIAWQFDSKIWRDSWPLNLKRSVIKTVIVEKSKKGTRKAVEESVQSLGSAIAITEWWETVPKGKPHTFDVVLTVADVPGQSDAESQIDLIRRINDTKPARSQFNFSLATQAAASLFIGGAARPAAYTRLNTVANY